MNSGDCSWVQPCYDIAEGVVERTEDEPEKSPAGSPADVTRLPHAHVPASRNSKERHGLAPGAWPRLRGREWPWPPRSGHTGGSSSCRTQSCHRCSCRRTLSVGTVLGEAPAGKRTAQSEHDAVAARSRRSRPRSTGVPHAARCGVAVGSHPHCCKPSGLFDLSFQMSRAVKPRTSPIRCTCFHCVGRT